ncbi:Integration host factor subunit beta [Candidatus Jidaibacter acanthamoeba]|uniref:Integration host factor subunit beta n=1 Tax=Candidatus Jidaibacter acanthamoebae TaxID=86105 RepID=A0A0C1R1Z1_9RICK|nr:HU family DNA-binding protein [Candidatus Jidaibacter acanthamoeba]KIE05683.1 Integration host factor subunit beta [Candidatus Jidaibacter acanthamoeba]KIE06280.1 Integration host factor subunit beta [Candidatus Jidaibacter acanthamoeba]
MGKSVFKKDIVVRLKEFNSEMPLSKIEKIVDTFFQEAATALVCGDRVELRGLGSMVVKKRTTRLAKNPRTNQKIEVGNKGALCFKPSKELIKKLNKVSS